MHRQCLYGPINSYHSFLWSNLILCLYNVDTFNICMKKFGLEKIFFDKMPSFFTDSYCAGVSNKHCLLTFFICKDIEFSFNIKIPVNRFFDKQ